MSAQYDNQAQQIDEPLDFYFSSWNNACDIIHITPVRRLGQLSSLAQSFSPVRVHNIECRAVRRREVRPYVFQPHHFASRDQLGAFCDHPSTWTVLAGLGGDCSGVFEFHGASLKTILQI